MNDQSFPRRARPRERLSKSGAWYRVRSTDLLQFSENRSIGRKYGGPEKKSPWRMQPACPAGMEVQRSMRHISPIMPFAWGSGALENVSEGTLAEGVGFEPTIRFPVYTLSKRAPSATRPPLRARRAQYSLGPRRDNPRGAGPIPRPANPAATMELPPRGVVGRQSVMRHRRMSWDVDYCFGSSAFRCRSFC